MTSPETTVDMALTPLSDFLCEWAAVERSTMRAIGSELLAAGLVPDEVETPESIHWTLIALLCGGDPVSAVQAAQTVADYRNYQPTIARVVTGPAVHRVAYVAASPELSFFTALALIFEAHRGRPELTLPTITVSQNGTCRSAGLSYGLSQSAAADLPGYIPGQSVAFRESHFTARLEMVGDPDKLQRVAALSEGALAEILRRLPRPFPVSPIAWA